MVKAPRLTINAINKAIRALGYKNVGLYKGRGYFYWSGGIASKFHQQGVYGSLHLSSMTLKQWVNDFKDKVKEVRR